MIPGRRLVFLVAMPVLILALGCNLPGTAMVSPWDQPFEAVEVILPNPAEAQAMAASLGRRLGVPVYDARLGTRRSLRLKATLNDLSTWQGSLSRTLLTHGGVGGLIGLGSATQFASITLSTAEKTGAVGLVLGLGWGLHVFLAGQDEFRRLGYYPAYCALMTLEVVSHDETGRYGTIARTPHLDLDVRPYLKPLPPEARTPAAIRKASLDAYTEALGAYLVKAGMPARPL